MKNSLKRLINLAVAAALILVVSACDEDDPVPAPSVSNPAATQVTAGTSTEISFDVTIPGGWTSSAVVGTGGTPTITTDLTTGDTDGTIVVSFAAGSTSGAHSVTLTVTDAIGNSDEGVAVIEVTDVPQAPVVTVRGNIEGTVTWSADNIYVLDTRVTVVDGATLNIDPGTVIKGNTGQQAAATALLVARGGTLNAAGTAQLPIIFTTIEDPITPSDIAAGNYSSTTSPTQAGRWGGVIILGAAPISAQNDNGDDITEVQIEGIPSSDPNGLYGGSDPNDNSGTISYISIRHGGTNIGAGNEINGLTLGGVGAGTTISNVEIVANADDGIEFFGGNVSIDGALVWNSFDDSMDTDQDWVGSVTNYIIVTPNTGSAFELDGPEGSTSRGVHNTFSNGIVYGGADIDHIIDWDDNTNTSITDTYFFGIVAGNVESFGGDGNGDSNNWETDLADNSAGYFDGVDSGVITYGVAVGSRSHGPAIADFAWTWAGHSGALAGLGL